MPYLLQLVAKTRSVIEELSLAANHQPTMLTEAYGAFVFKCSILACPRFQYGFKDEEQRNRHQGTHRSRFRCTREGCDYSILGFSTIQELDKHLIEHDSQSSDILFPEVRHSSLAQSLENAIDRDDFSSVLTLSTEISALLRRENNFLLRAVKGGHLEAFRALIAILSTKKDLNYRDPSGKTPLHYIAENSNEEMAKLIIEKDVALNAKVKRKDARSTPGCDDTPLMIAASRGHHQIFRLLWGRDQRDLKKNPSRRVTQLQLAAESGNVKFLSLVLDIDGASYAQGKAYMTAIGSAACQGHKSAVRVLLEKGPELNAEKGYTLVLRNLIPKGIDAMLAHAMRSIDAEGRTKDNALQSAASEGNTEEVLLLLENGADINYHAPQHGTALAAAAGHGNLSLVQQLLDKGANVHCLGGHRPAFPGPTAVQQAVLNGYEAVLSLLLQYGANANEDYVWTTILDKAMSLNNEVIIRLLVKYGADVNRGTGHRPLNRAAQHCSEAIVSLLVNNGADVNAADRIDTPLQRAAAHGRVEIVRVLLNHKADPNVRIFSSALFGRFLTDYPKLREGYPMTGEITALKLAAHYGYEAIVDLLLQHGATVDGETGETALQIAKRFKYEGLVKLLVENGASLNERDGPGSKLQPIMIDVGFHACLSLDSFRKCRTKI